MQAFFCESENCFSRAHLNRLVSLVKRNYGKVDNRLLSNAFSLAKQAHGGQVRASEEPYFVHPLETAFILAGFGLSSKVVAAALLHDVLEDTEVKPAELRKKFGKEVFSLVDGVTKLDQVASESRSQNTLQSLHSLLFATTKDPRVILIKLADKLHNLRTLGFLPARDRKRIASEALEIYVPIAHKIGLEALAVELEDLAFRHARPETYSSVLRNLKEMRKAKGSEISLMTAILQKRLKNARFSRLQRSVYSVYTKMHSTGRMLSEMNDTVILKVVVKKELDCYLALGAIHGVFPPLPNKVKDFIAAPKPSLYRVLQTTVFGPKEKPVKVRIMTWEMDEVNRLGVVAYRKLFGERLSEHMRQNLLRLGTLLNQGRGENGFVHALKSDFLTNPIYVFTAKGRLVELPKKSTVLDFAFATEKNWALHLLKARVNGKKAGFGKRLESGNLVELFFSKKVRAKRGWGSFASGFLAKKAIEKALSKKKKTRAKH